MSLYAGVPVVVALLFAVLVAPAVWGGLRGSDTVRDGLILAPYTNEREKCLIDGGHSDDVELSRFVIRNVPSGAQLAVHGPVPQVCLQLTVLPRRFVRDDEPHEFTLYTGQIPPDVRTRPGAMPYGKSAVLVREG
jgi:hypothetical protein